MRHYERTDSTHAVIAGAVRKFRKQISLTQEGLAEAAGLSRATVAAIEGGRYNSLTLATLERLGTALSVTVADLVARPREDAALLKRFKDSPWFSAVHPTEEELARLKQVPPTLWGAKAPSAGTLADLIRLIRQHDETAVR